MNILIDHLSHTFPARPPRPALAEVSFSVPTGQFCAVLGPSGCGKTTLLRLAAGLLLPTAGQIWLDDQPPEQAAAQRRVAWLAQSPALFPWLTARANVALVGRFARPGERGQLEPMEALARVGLADAATVYPFQLSGGMQQRLALARLLVQGADIWLMDEPFAALDALTRERLAAELLSLWQPLRRPEGQPPRRLAAPWHQRPGQVSAPPMPLSKRGAGVDAPLGGRSPEGQPLRPTVLWVTHHIHEAMRLADRALVLSPRPGKVILDLAIDLPRPRREDSPDFQSGLSELKAALGLAVPAEAG